MGDSYKIDGNPDIGFRVIDDDAGPLTGRHPTEAGARAAAGLDKNTAPEPVKRGPGRPKKSD